MVKKEYKEFKLYALDKYMDIMIKIVDKEYKTIKKLKDTKRNYVGLIELNKKKYILKYSYNEQNRKFKHYISKFKKGEALETFENVNKLIDKGLDDLCKPLIVGVKRFDKKIKESFMLFEYINGEYFDNYLKITKKEKEQLVLTLKQLHKLGVYHGDANHTNFIKYDNSIKIIDTKCKRSYTTFKQWYDVVTLDDCIKDVYTIYKVNYTNIFFLLAFMLKKYKKLRRDIKRNIKWRI